MTVAPFTNDVGEITETWPASRAVSDDVPPRAKEYLTQAIASKKAPAGAIMLAASAIDSMLKDKGYKDGSLNKRIEEAAAQNLITPEMAFWAHDIRLGANDQRHADDAAPLPTEAEVDKALEFATALAEFLYVLPAMVTRGRKPPVQATT
jgi:hypothetical protein